MHEKSGATWVIDGGVFVVTGWCSCGWSTTAVPVGPGWIGDLDDQYAEHVLSVTLEP